VSRVLINRTALAVILFALLLPASVLAEDPTDIGDDCPLMDLEDDDPSMTLCQCYGKQVTDRTTFKRACSVNGIAGTQTCTYSVTRWIWRKHWLCFLAPTAPCPPDKIVREETVCSDLCVTGTETWPW